MRGEITLPELLNIDGLVFWKGNTEHIHHSTGRTGFEYRHAAALGSDVIKIMVYTDLTMEQIGTERRWGVA